MPGPTSRPPLPAIPGACSAARATSARSVSNVRIDWRFVEVDPADGLELPVMPCEVTAGGHHEEVVHGLVDPRARLDEGVVDRLEPADDLDLQPRLLADLADRRRLGGLARVRGALGQRPGHGIAIPPTAARHELEPVPVRPDDDAAG